ncbi:potassium voltage-gated channel subfamily E member 2 [Oncorhynchus tshawytscha]|uniref:Potassium voltage-gated channel subfamily E member 2 n=1 Tax=Oncorhynchus tshawytscha TaxID=74940 RepID=A0AAZ3PAG7_ONCTS|nr:potassium voltage-gated channel subfamily E member 2 [Oncorhynchus tshawytscha]
MEKQLRQALRICCGALRTSSVAAMQDPASFSTPVIVTSSQPPWSDTGNPEQVIMLPNWSNMTLHLEDSLTRALGHYLDNWSRNSSKAEQALDNTLAEENFRNVIWYLIVMIGMFAFIVVAILVSTVKSKRREHSNDPYHKYIEEDWTAQLQQQSFVINNPTAN